MPDTAADFRNKARQVFDTFGNAFVTCDVPPAVAAAMAPMFERIAESIRKQNALRDPRIEQHQPLEVSDPTHR